MNIRSAEVLIELEAILKATPGITTAGAAVKTIPLSQDTNMPSVYANMSNIVPELLRNGPEADAYDYHGFFTLVVNTDCASDKLLVYDVVDSIQRSILNDNAIWGHLVDRDIISIEFDNAELYPLRSAIIALEVIFRISCT